MTKTEQLSNFQEDIQTMYKRISSIEDEMIRIVRKIYHDKTITVDVDYQGEVINFHNDNYTFDKNISEIIKENHENRIVHN